MTIFDSFKKYKNNVALISNLTGPVKYIEMEKKSYAIGKIIPKNSLVILFIDNSVPSIIFYTSLIKNNSVVMLLDQKMSKKDYLEIIESYKPNFIIAPSKYSKDLINVRSENLNKYYDLNVWRTIFLKKKKMNKNLCLLLSTSGSMGSKKFVMLSKNNLKENSLSIIKYLNLKSVDRAITNMPSSYSYMLSIINTHLEIGASLFLTNNTIVQKDFWVDYSKNNVTSFNGVPYIYEILIKLGLNKIFTKSLKTLTQAGGKLDLDSSKIIINFCKSKKIKFFAMYGQTEASPRMTYLDWKFSEKKIGSIGKPIPGGKIILYDKKNRTIKNPNEIGELVYKGKNVSMGYSQNFKDLNLGDKNKQKLKTGDLAFFDKDKFLFLVGRKKRIVKIFGTRFDLNEIEKKMEQNGLAVACKGLDDKLGVYFIKKLKMDKVLNKLVEITGQNKIAFNLIALNKFPRTFSGKINYTKLKNIHA